MTQKSVQNYHSLGGTCTSAAVHSELITPWLQALCSGILGEGGFPLLVTMLVVLEIHFTAAAGVWFLWRWTILHFFQIPLLSATSVLPEQPAANSTSPAVFCIVWRQGFDPQEETSSPEGTCDFHIHLNVQIWHKTWSWEAWGKGHT